jgi:DNA-binding MarR family transcriptional regulator
MTGDSDQPRTAALKEVEQQMGAFTRRFREALQKAASAVDPSLPPFGFKLLRIIERGPISASAAADLLVVDRSVISRQVRQLEELGLVDTTTDQADGRKRILRLTELGAQRMSEASPTGPILVNQLLSTWTTEELTLFAAQIERLNS